MCACTTLLMPPQGPGLGRKIQGFFVFASE
jgi:hypothetical protein